MENTFSFATNIPNNRRISGRDSSSFESIGKEMKREK